MPTECELLVSIWCSPAPIEPLAKALHTECLSYLESVKLAIPRTLQSLPAEIQSQIIEKLGFVGRAKLRETNHFYNATISAVTPNSEELRELILATESEDYATEKQLLAYKRKKNPQWIRAPSSSLPAVCNMEGVVSAW
ncbi:hypothetical protein ACHAO8_007653 [Botrytis cinerea]